MENNGADPAFGPTDPSRSVSAKGFNPGEISKPKPIEFRDEFGELIASTERPPLITDVELFDRAFANADAEANEAERVKNELLLVAREIASMTTMMTSNSDAYLAGYWDKSLPRLLREVASGSRVVLEHDCSNARKP